MERHVFQAGAAHGIDDEALDRSEKRAQHDAAHKAPGKRQARIDHRERACDQRRYGELKRHDARRVVEQAFSLQERLMVLIDGEALAQRGDGHCIGGTQGRTQGKRRSKRNGRHKRMRKEAHDEHDEQNEPQCQRQHRPALPPQRLLVRLDGVPVEQGRNEEDEEEVWVKRDGNRRRAHGKRDTEHDLHERGRCLRENLGHDTRHEDGGKHENDGQDGLHMCSNLLVRSSAATSAALKNRAAAAKRPSGNAAAATM